MPGKSVSVPVPRPVSMLAALVAGLALAMVAFLPASAQTGGDTPPTTGTGEGAPTQGDSVGGDTPPTLQGGTTAPGTTAPGTTAPGTTAPGTTAPGTTAPGTTAPGTVQQPTRVQAGFGGAAGSPSPVTTPVGAAALLVLLVGGAHVARLLASRS